MIKKVQRYFLELKNSDYKIYNLNLPKNVTIELDHKKDSNINKFFYKNIGLEHYWRDRLLWSDKEWFRYVSNKNLETWIMKADGKFAGFYEQEYHPARNEVELINMGILKEYRGKGLGSKLLQHSTQESFKTSIKRIWVHTCSLDHKRALPNYKSKSFKIFREEEIDFVA